MDDLLSGGGIGMGILFFGITVLGAVRRKAGNVVARGLYPKLAQKLGLTYEPSSYKGGVGRLVGEYQGYRVTVDPDDQRRIYLRFESRPAVSLHSYAHNKRPASGQRTFRPTSKVLSSQFQTAQASDVIMARLNGDEALPALIKPLKFLRELKTLSVTENGVTAVFDYGSPPYIPASIVEDVLPRMAALARVVEVPEGAEVVQRAQPSNGAQDAGKSVA
jgi:hypothetical protein